MPLDTVHTSTRLPKKLKDELEAHAKREGVRLSEMMRIALREWLKTSSRKGNGKPLTNGD